ncbi:MAG: hypothetical protein IT350_10235 [Deltaproteobacteria bacterium]|nr:hypothetical protein [Deltaproteobacteria bacterium]
MRRISGLLLLTTALAVLLAAGSALAEDAKPTVTPFGQIYANYTYNASGYEDYDTRFPTNDYNSFEVTRSYIGLKAQLNKQWSANVTFDSRRDYAYSKTTVSTGVADDPATADVDESETEVFGTTGARTGQYTVYMRFAYATFQPYDEFGVTFGQIKTPVYDHYTDVWYLAYITGEPWFKYAFTRNGLNDLGVSLGGNFPKGYGKWGVMFGNGEGGSTAEVNAGKAVQASVLVRPLASIDAAKGLSLWGGFNYDKIQPDHPEELRTTMRGNLAYRYDVKKDEMGFIVAGDFVQSTYTIDIEGTDDVVSQSMAGWVDFWFATHYGVALRYDSYDPNTQNEEDTGIGYQDETSYILAAFYVKPIKNVKIALDLQRTSYTAEIADDKGEMVTKGPDQILGLHTDIAF